MKTRSERTQVRLRSGCCLEIAGWGEFTHLFMKTSRGLYPGKRLFQGCVFFF